MFLLLIFYGGKQVILSESGTLRLQFRPKVMDALNLKQDFMNSIKQLVKVQRNLDSSVNIGKHCVEQAVI